MSSWNLSSISFLFTSCSENISNWPWPAFQGWAKKSPHIPTNADSSTHLEQKLWQMKVKVPIHIISCLSGNHGGYPSSFHHPFFQTSPRWYIFKQRTFECGVPCLTLQPAVFPRVASIPPHCPTVNLHHALHFYYLFPSLFMTITSSPYQYIYIYPFSTCLLYIYIYVYYISIFYAKKVIKKLQPTSYPSTNIALCTFCSWMWSSPSCNSKGGKQVSAIYTTSINDFLGEIFQGKKGTPSS